MFISKVRCTCRSFAVLAQKSVGGSAGSCLSSSSSSILSPFDDEHRTETAAGAASEEFVLPAFVDKYATPPPPEAKHTTPWNIRMTLTARQQRGEEDNEIYIFFISIYLSYLSIWIWKSTN